MIKSYEQLEQIAAEYAKAEANRVYLAEFRKSKKAVLMKRAEAANSELSGVAQEREAYAHPEYLELLEGLKEATEQAVYLRWQLEAWKMRFESWRTKESTKRAEMNLR